MQVMVEGPALAAFGFMHQLTSEPLLKQLLRYVMSDEARHVAFGVLSLREVYGMTDAEIMERSGVRLRGGGADARPVPVPGGLGASWCEPPGRRPARAQRPDTAAVPDLAVLQDRAQLQEARPLDRNGEWLRRRFEEMDVIQFEHLEDTGEEYAAADLSGGGQPTPRRRSRPSLCHSWR